MPAVRHRPSILATAMLLVAAGWSPAVATAESPVAVVRVAGTPFHPTTGAVARTTQVVLSVSRTAPVTVGIRDAFGRHVTTIAKGVTLEPGRHRFTWDGRTSDGVESPNGGYRFDIATRDGTELVRTQALTTKATFAVYRPRPSAIVVAIDAGHGAPDPGAYYGGFREADFNLDIAKRTEAMLSGANVKAVLVRKGNGSIADPSVDRNADGDLSRADELQARLDVVNAARPDAMAIVMNNAYGCHCAHGTETFTHPERPWTPEALDFAELMQQEHMRLLARHATSSWSPHDRGARTSYRFYQTKPYSADYVPRPSTAPTILVESLFMDQPNELAMLKRADVRQTIAEAYYNAIARFLASRRYGLRYEVVSAPASVKAGQRMKVEIGVTNRGQATAQGWQLRLGYVRPPKPANGGYVPEVPYNGSGSHGTQMRRVDIPTLAPGASAVVAFDVVSPTETGQWILNADGVLPDLTWISSRGVSMLQHPLLVEDTELPPVEPPPASGPTDAETRELIRTDPRVKPRDRSADEPLFCPIYDD